MVAKIVAMLKAAFVDWNFWVAIVTAGTALLALFQTRYQMKLSNKQHLFDRRLKCYVIANELFQSYEMGDMEEVGAIFKKENDTKALTMVAVVTLVRLTDNSHFEDANLSFELLAEEQCPDFVRKINELKNIAVEIPLVFNKREARVISDFVRKYARFVERSYGYSRYANDEKMAGIHSELLSFAGIEIEKPTIEQHESKLRERFLDAYDDLNDAYKVVKEEKTLENLCSQMKLS